MSGGGLSYSWITTDAATGVAAPRLAEIQRQEPQSMLGAALNFPITELNAIWQAPDLGDEFRRPATSDVPVLFVAGTDDGLTPPEQARTIISGFSRGALLVVEGGGHVSQLAAPGLASAVSDYLAGVVPPDRIAMPLPDFAPLLTPRK
jgi:pimeloyl-ACP methyl ester carboxylesterase